MALGELEMNLFQGESITISGPAQINVQGGLSASVMQQGGAVAKGKTAMATAGGTKSVGLVGGGKVSAINTSAIATGAKATTLGATLTAMAPTLITIAALTAGGYLLYKLNHKVMAQFDE